MLVSPWAFPFTSTSVRLTATASATSEFAMEIRFTPAAFSRMVERLMPTRRSVAAGVWVAMFAPNERVTNRVARNRVLMAPLLMIEPLLGSLCATVDLHGFEFGFGRFGFRLRRGDV